MGNEEAISAKERPTNKLATDTRIQPYTADTGPPLLYAVFKPPATAIAKHFTNQHAAVCKRLQIW